MLDRIWGLGSHFAGNVNKARLVAASPSSLSVSPLHGGVAISHTLHMSTFVLRVVEQALSAIEPSLQGLNTDLFK